MKYLHKYTVKKYLNNDTVKLVLVALSLGEYKGKWKEIEYYYVIYNEFIWIYFKIIMFITYWSEFIKIEILTT